LDLKEHDLLGPPEKKLQEKLVNNRKNIKQNESGGEVCRVWAVSFCIKGGREKSRVTGGKRAQEGLDPHWETA